jgi:hypothetical protein
MPPTDRQLSRRNPPRDRETLRAELDELLENPALRPPDWLTKLGTREAVRATEDLKAAEVLRSAGARAPELERAAVVVRATATRRIKIKEITDVRDGLTRAQGVVLATMFAHGAPVENGVAPFRICTKGLSELADLAHVGRDALRHKMLPALREKGCIWEVGRYDPDTRHPRSYLVLDFLTIRTMWSASGIRHFIPGRTPQLCGPDGSPRTFTPPADFDPMAYVNTVASSAPEAPEPLARDAAVAHNTAEAMKAIVALSAVGNPQQAALIERHRIDGQIRLRRVVTDQEIDPVWRDWAKRLLDQGALAWEKNPAAAG